VNGYAGTAEGGDHRGIEQRLQAAFNEVQIGGAGREFLSERLFELARLELELGYDLC
jgi:hypothetical protein